MVVSTTPEASGMRTRAAFQVRASSSGSFQSAVVISDTVVLPFGCPLDSWARVTLAAHTDRHNAIKSAPVLG